MNHLIRFEQFSSQFSYETTQQNVINLILLNFWKLLEYISIFVNLSILCNCIIRVLMILWMGGGSVLNCRKMKSLRRRYDCVLTQVQMMMLMMMVALKCRTIHLTSRLNFNKSKYIHYSTQFDNGDDMTKKSRCYQIVLVVPDIMLCCQWR